MTVSCCLVSGRLATWPVRIQTNPHNVRINPAATATFIFYSKLIGLYHGRVNLNLSDAVLTKRAGQAARAEPGSLACFLIARFFRWDKKKILSRFNN
ncbi:MAG: hypothetical protein OP8BY_0618 [Candidatus Saccharicenans subterraneus]|uniref:Uncharacterized protein n=1 Tax=Candidatus Saccharicenans subterraneus TaxID=2508984 RepID=A0A3E2BKD7_9BACT|nr:MAG: hypothetical protein OP8BY_0618 [Candidatus Saccharicenans subterraneum]